MDPVFFEIRRSETAGRYVVAARDIAEGECVTSSPPFCCVLYTGHISTHCSFCFRPLPQSPIRCQDCSILCYCSDDCLRRDVRNHSFECGALQLDRSFVDDADARSLLRLLRLWADDCERKQHGSQGSDDDCSESPFKQIANLVGNETDFTPDRIKHKRTQARLILRMLPEIQGSIEIDELVRLACIIDCNAFTIRSWISACRVSNRLLPQS